MNCHYLRHDASNWEGGTLDGTDLYSTEWNARRHRADARSQRSYGSAVGVGVPCSSQGCFSRVPCTEPAGVGSSQGTIRTDGMLTGRLRWLQQSDFQRKI